MQVFTRDFVRRNLGLLAALGSIYLIFLVSVAFVRWRRTHESWSYMEKIPDSK
jgi:hypothetical protein